MRIRTIYARPRVNRLLDEATKRPLCLVVAGAGFGKTTAARLWLDSATCAHTWVSLSSGDSDVCWEKLCDAIEALDSPASDELRVIGMPRNDWERARVVKLAFAKCTESIIICIDDLQYLRADSPILALIRTLVFERVDNLHILLLSRNELNLPYGTMVSKGLCEVLSEDTLRFNQVETSGYLSMRGLRLTKNAVNQICTMSEGWVSAIFLMSEGIRAGGSIADRTDIDRLFAENLMAPLCPRDREMLCRLAPLEPLSAECAIEAMGDSRAETLLEMLMCENAFITKDERGLYHFHPLLHEYLAQCCVEDATQFSIYRRAGLWYLDHTTVYPGFMLKLVEKAGCIEELLERLDDPNARHLSFFDMDIICSLAERLPDEECIAHPVLYFQIVFYLLLSGDPHNVSVGGHLLQIMQAYFSSNDHPWRNHIRGELIVISRVMGFGNTDAQDEPLMEAARLLGGSPSKTLHASDPFTFGLPLLLESEWMSAGTLDTAVQRCQYNPYELVTDGFGRGSEQLVCAESALLRCQMDNVRTWSEQAIQEATRCKQFFVMASAHCVLMRRALFLGDDEEAVSCLSAIRSLILEAEHDTHAMAITVPMLREVTALSECFLNTALQREHDIPASFLDGTHTSLMVGLGIPEVFSARAMYATENTSGTERMCKRLNRLPDICQEARLTRLIVEALAREKLYGKGSGTDILTEALHQAESDGVLLLFAENPDILPLIDAIRSSSQETTPFLSSVISAIETYSKARPKRMSTSPATLTTRELEVLRLASRGLTRSQIAEELFIKEDTVKKHLSSIYRKLGASNRTDALRIARIRCLL